MLALSNLLLYPLVSDDVIIVYCWELGLGLGMQISLRGGPSQVDYCYPPPPSTASLLPMVARSYSLKLERNRFLCIGVFQPGILSKSQISTPIAHSHITALLAEGK